jgi:hypothetical protein
MEVTMSPECFPQAFQFAGVIPAYGQHAFRIVQVVLVSRVFGPDADGPFDFTIRQGIAMKKKRVGWIAVKGIEGIKLIILAV